MTPEQKVEVIKSLAFRHYTTCLAMTDRPRDHRMKAAKAFQDIYLDISTGNLDTFIQNLRNRGYKIPD